VTERRIRRSDTLTAMARRTVAIQFVRSALGSAAARGLDVEAALQRAGISSQLIANDATRVTRQQATALVQALWTATDDELAGFGPKPVPRGTFRMMTLGVIHTADLRAALRRLVDFARIAAGFEAIELSDDAGYTRLSLDPGARTGTDQIVVDIILSVVHRFAGWLIGERIELSGVELPGPAPSYASDYLLIYGTAPVFGAATAAMEFDVRYLGAPVIRTERELFAFLHTSPNELLFRDDYNPSTSSRVRTILERSSGDDATSAGAVAARLSISTQHLRRLLREEGTTFREIREELLRDEAISSLVGGRESVEELSARLGFSEPSAFRRAFRRWTGSPPGAYRPTGSERG
jgi:AraC-like DNA-binding protein